MIKKQYSTCNLQSLFSSLAFQREPMKMLHVQILSLSVWLLFQLIDAAPPSMALPNCQEKCGNVTISYPFGIGKDCYYNESYAVICNNVSLNSTKPFLMDANLELLSVDLFNQSVTLNAPIIVANSRCHGKADGEKNSGSLKNTIFRGSPFRYSSEYNKFIVVGCDNAILHDTSGKIIAGCTSECNINSPYTRNSTRCYGIQCCETSIPSDLFVYNITISGKAENCTKAFLAENNWYSKNLNDIYAINEEDRAPVIINWRPKNASSFSYNDRTPGYDCFTPIPGSVSSYHCDCGWAYEGNPFIQNGCKVVEECANCEEECEYGFPRKPYCKRNYKTEIIVGSSLGGGLVLLLVCGLVFFLYTYIKRRRIMKLKKKFFKRNGGLLLEQQISSTEGLIDKTIVFNSLELEKATDNFNDNRILGQGGQGTVYKGMLTDGQIVAIKRSTVVDESQLEPFINELVILSQINHRNIVKLLGCCLETEVPLLIYEYISNGNLYELIQTQDNEFPLSWRMRLQIATEIAGALAYLHSASYMPIYHRDIKSTNILLDEKYRAKIADFGTSRSIALEQTHLTTVVQGTFGYLDPEYFQSGQFTEKSDVYSYGVVLAELLTGQKAVSSSMDRQEERSLATRFLLYEKEMRLFDILDSRVKEEALVDDIIAVANIANRCLSLSGKKRPKMSEVMMELEGIRMCHLPKRTTDNLDEMQYIMEMNGPLDTTLSSIKPSIIRRIPQSDVHPLLANIV